MAKIKTSYECTACGYVTASYLGKCPECSSWGTIEASITPSSDLIGSGKEQKRTSVLDRFIQREDTAPTPLSQVKAEDAERFHSGYPELDRVLGGGVMPGSYILIGGDPGIGKSTLMLQSAESMSQTCGQVMYVAGEESPYQIKLRAERLNLKTDNIIVFPETNILKVVQELCKSKPPVVVIDSIQSVYHPELSGTPGSMNQIRECAGLLMDVAKSLNITIFLIGHVTKDGQVSGPKILEHTVDAVLYFEGDRYKNLRVLRTVKNRFGNTQEIGVFEMMAGGLREVTNPSELFLSGEMHRRHPGSIVVATMEGTRPILVELQALVGQSTYSSPRRVANGVEQGRLNQIVAVLERRIGLNFSQQDVYINVVGGIRIDEPAADLGIALAMISSYQNVPIKKGTVVCGEIGLTGEIRAVRLLDQRIREAERIGFDHIIMPEQDVDRDEPKASKKATKERLSPINTHEASTMMEAIVAGMGGIRDNLDQADETTLNSPAKEANAPF